MLESICLHVDAKRCLCAIDVRYHACLSADSVRSLALQGGGFSASQAAAFPRRPYVADALRLRRWDDLAKVTGRPPPGWRTFWRSPRASQWQPRLRSVAPTASFHGVCGSAPSACTSLVLSIRIGCCHR